MDWKYLLAYITGSVDQELRLRNEYLVAENHILRQQIRSRVRLTDAERKTLARDWQEAGKKALEQVATIVTPDTILAWHRKFADQKGTPSQPRKSVGRPRTAPEIEDLVGFCRKFWYVDVLR
jgi:putative transposase